MASNVLVQASLVLTNGVAIGTDGSYGLGIGTTNAIRGEGSATLPNRIVHIQNVQEAPRTWGHGGHVRQLDGYPSDLGLRFTELCGMPGRTSTVFDGASADPPFSALSWRDCVLRGMSASLYPVSTSEVVLALTNNVIERCTLNLGKSYASLDAPLAVHLFNNLFRGGSQAKAKRHALSLTYTPRNCLGFRPAGRQKFGLYLETRYGAPKRA